MATDETTLEELLAEARNALQGFNKLVNADRTAAIEATAAQLIAQIEGARISLGELQRLLQDHGDE